MKDGDKGTAHQTLSAKAIELLTLVGDRTEWEGDERPGRKLTCFFIPVDPNKICWSKTLGRDVIVSGGGDASAFKALERKGLIRKERTADYAYSITEDGLLALATAQEAGVSVKRERKVR